MTITVQLEPAAGTPAPVDYRWDTDTDILTASIPAAISGDGLSGTIELEGSDGSWVSLEVGGGRIRGVEVAVWPEVRKLGALSPPAEITDAAVRLPARASQPGIAALEVASRTQAEADVAERTFHFRFGRPRPVRAVRIARDLLLEVDDRDRISGLWLLNVPPFPGEQ